MSPRPSSLLATLLCAALWGAACDNGRVPSSNNGPNNNNNTGADGGVGAADSGTSTGVNGTPCADGRVLCNGKCVDTSDDARHCGMCNRSCAAGNVCTSSQAAPHCVAVSNCPTNECTGFAYCDIGSQRCMPGCVRDDQCGSNETCNLETHDCDCRAGHHRCGGICVPDDTVNTCGGRCDPCPSDPNGSASCDQGQCKLNCGSGFQACGERCSRPDDPAACGPSCTACPGDPHGRATCDGTSCGMACETGFHLCGTTCVADTAVSSCGARCDACPTDPNGAASCNGVDCTISCSQGYRLCNGACAQCPNVNNTTCDGASCIASPCQGNQELCGVSCVTCPNPTGVAGFQCNGTSCEIASCQTDYLLCGGLCAPCPTGAAVAATACGAAAQCEATACTPNNRFCPSGCCAMADAQLAQGSAEKGVRAVLASNGDLHVLYEDRSGSPYGLRYGVRTAAGQWSTEVLTMNDEPQFFDLAVEGTTVHVFYIHETGTFDRELVYATKSAGGSFTSTPFTDPVELQPVHVRARGGLVFLAFVAANQQGTDDVLVAWNDGSGWGADSVTMTRVRSTDLAIDPTNGNPVVVVAGQEIGDEVRVVRFGTTPAPMTVERVRADGQPQVAVDANGTIHVAYAAGGIRYASGTTSFSPRALTGGTVVAELEVDGMGRPHILYGDDVAQGMSYTESSGQAWRTVSLPLLRRASFMDDSDFSLDSAGAPTFVYSLNGSFEVRFMR